LLGNIFSEGLLIANVCLRDIGYEYIEIMLRRLFCSADSKVKILRSTSNNIHFNLATEEYLFEVAELTLPTLFLWQNSPTIVIGQHQNAWKECRNEEMKAQGVLLSSRKTGGGACSLPTTRARTKTQERK
jgi:hypothetical protein